jgi:predicted peptidase
MIRRAVLFLLGLASVAAAQDAPAPVALDPNQAVATTFGFHKFPAGAGVSLPTLNTKFSYLMFLPHAYVDTHNLQPLFIFLHGNGHQGANLEGIVNEGPANFIQNNADLREQFPLVGLFPQCPAGMRWDTPGMNLAVVGLIDQVIKKYRIDPDRVYVSGLSMGGEATWMVAEAAPDRFALVVPISAVAVDPQRTAALLKHTGTWIICGSNDGGFTEGSKRMADVFEQEGAEMIKLTVFPNEGHGVWGRFYPDPNFYAQLLTIRRHAPRTKAAATRPAPRTAATRPAH